MPRIRCYPSPACTMKITRLSALHVLLLQVLLNAVSAAEHYVLKSEEQLSGTAISANGAKLEYATSGFSGATSLTMVITIDNKSVSIETRQAAFSSVDRDSGVVTNRGDGFIYISINPAAPNIMESLALFPERKLAYWVKFWSRPTVATGESSPALIAVLPFATVQTVPLRLESWRP